MIDVELRVRVRKKRVLIFSFRHFVSLDDIKLRLEKRNIEDRVEVEYIVIDKQKRYTIALYFLKANKITGVVFPCGYFQNNTT